MTDYNFQKTEILQNYLPELKPTRFHIPVYRQHFTSTLCTLKKTLQFAFKTFLKFQNVGRGIDPRFQYAHTGYCLALIETVQSSDKICIYVLFTYKQVLYQRKQKNVIITNYFFKMRHGILVQKDQHTIT